MADSYSPLFGAGSQDSGSSSESTAPVTDTTPSDTGYAPLFTQGPVTDVSSTTHSIKSSEPETGTAQETGYSPLFGGTATSSTDVSDTGLSATSSSSADSQNPTMSASKDSEAGYSPLFGGQGSVSTPESTTPASDEVSVSASAKEFLTGLGQLLHAFAGFMKTIVPEATDPRYKDIQESIVSLTGMEAEKASEALSNFSVFIDKLSDLTDNVAAEIENLDTSTSLSSLADTAGPQIVLDSPALKSTESASALAPETTTQRSTSASDYHVETPSDDNTVTLTSASESTLDSSPSHGQNGESGTHLSSASDSSEPVGGTHLSDADNSTPVQANNLSTDSALTSGRPTQSIDKVLDVPSSGGGHSVIGQNMNDIRATYPSVPINNEIQSQIAAELMGQNAAPGSAQPVDTIHLTDQQLRTLSEAIAHNINLRRQAAAAEMIGSMPFGSGNYDGFGYGAGDFELEGVSSDFQQAVLEIADQVVQAGIPYAWGGGTIDGPSQGISDGGGYADACGDYAKIGFDCSGFSRYVFYQATGVELPRVSQAQAQYCIPVDEPMVGDLGFPTFAGPGHVVVYVGNGEIAEAQQSGTMIMYSPASPSYVWGRPPESPNWNY